MRKIELNPQPADMAGEICERLPLGVVQELQAQLHADALEGEEYCDFVREETEFHGLVEVDADEFFDRFCSPLGPTGGY